MELRDYQVDALEKIYAAWAEGHLGVMLQLATGAGKTVTFCEILKNHKGRAIVIAHRNQLVAQTSLCLAKNGVYHDIIASKSVIRVIAALHRFHLGKSFYRPQRHIIAAGVDTLITHKNPTFKDVSLAIVDEGHHVLRKNKWGKALEMFPNARVLLPTATPLRADGYGLGRNADGVADVLIEGVGMRELITRGCLSDYQIAMPPSDLKLDSVKISAGGRLFPRWVESRGASITHYRGYRTALFTFRVGKIRLNVRHGFRNRRRRRTKLPRCRRTCGSH